MSMRHEDSQASPITAGYVRRSTRMQLDNFSREAQMRGMTDECQHRSLPAPIFYEDDESSARGEQIAKRPQFKKLLDDVAAGRVQIVMVHSLDRWSRNVMVTLQSFRILSRNGTAFISLSENIDYTSAEGRLQLTILAAFAAYFSDSLAKHTSKGKKERAAQGLHNGDTPFGYVDTGPKTPPEHDPREFPGLRMIGELRMQGMEGEHIADTVNAAGYRTGSKRFGDRLFTKDTINAIVRNEFYAAFAPGDDRGTIQYQEQRYRGQHPAAFTYEEWERIRTGSRINYNAPHRAEQARRIYEFAGYIADIRCGLTLRCRGGHKYCYYKDVAKTRQLPCPAGGFLQVRVDLVHQQFGTLLTGLTLPLHWREEIGRKMLEAAQKLGIDSASIEREKERLKLKRKRTLKQHREGYINDEELRAEIASIELTLHELEVSEADGLRLEDIFHVMEQLPGMATLWECATPEERREMVTLLLEPGGLLYDLERQMIAAIKPRPVFLPLLLLIGEGVEYEETTRTLFMSQWRRSN